MKITIGSDHRGYDLKESVKNVFRDIDWIDVGASDATERTDYPIFAKPVCENILAGKAEWGILMCGSGVGMSIAANRYKKIYAALCWNEVVAKQAREHDGANVLVLPADFVDVEQASEIVKAWLFATFNGGRYQERLDMIDGK